VQTPILVLLLALVGYAHPPHAEATSDPPTKTKAGSNQGMTLDEISRGLKSAAKNIEEEIPKIGPAIGKIFKQVTGNGKETHTSDRPAEKAQPKK